MEADRGSEVAGVMMRLTLVTDREADEADDLDEVRDLVDSALADLALAYLLACSSETDGAVELAADIHAAMITLTNTH